MFGIKSRVLFVINRFKWRILNKNNSTIAKNMFDFSLVNVGNYTYGVIRVLDSNHISKLSIGDFCSIAPDVTFILNSDHYTNNLSTFPFKVMCLECCKAEAISYGDIIVDDDVWIGCGATILSGVHIGQGAIIAAGSVVSKDVPPYSIVGGVPAKIIKYRFTQEIIDYLMTLNFKSLTKSKIRDNIDVLYKKIDDLKIDEIKELFNWFPKK